MFNGIFLMGGAALLLLIYTHGSISFLVVMYSINVFATFSLSELGMSRYFIKNRKREKDWKKHLPVHMTGLTLCLTILIITTFEKFTRGVDHLAHYFRGRRDLLPDPGALLRRQDKDP